MRLNTLGRFLGALCLAGSLSYVAAAPASASTPNWHMTATPDPGIVANGADVAYTVHIWNEGPSNISTLYLSTMTTDVPVYLVNDPDYPACQSGTTAQLNCAFGELTPSDATGGIWLTVGYKTHGTSPYNPQFLVNSNGFTKTDKHNTSHGDTLGLNPNLTTDTALRSDQNFGGGFVLDTSDVHTNLTLGRNNHQSTSVTPPGAFIPVTTEDGSDLTVPFSCDDHAAYCNGKTPFGEWSKVDVNHDQNFGGTYFPITIMLYGKSVPTNLDLSSIQVIHVDDLGAPVGDAPLMQCAPDAALENCIQVTKVGSNYKIVAWVNENGGFKGMG